MELCNKFLEYLRTTHQVIHTKRKLHTNTIASYWSAFLGTLHAAHRDRKIKENPCPYLERAESIPTDKVGLSAEELIRLSETPCEVPVLKTAFLFSCLTGLRKSDVKTFSWDMIQPEADGTLYITTRMQKTKQIVHNPIGDEALALINSDTREGLVFPGFKDNMTQTPLKQWLKTAGITKISPTIQAGIHIVPCNWRQERIPEPYRNLSGIRTSLPRSSILTALTAGRRRRQTESH